MTQTDARIAPLGTAEWRAVIEEAGDAPPAASPHVAEALARGRGGRARAVLLDGRDGVALIPFVSHDRRVGEIVEALPYGLACGPVTVAGDPPPVDMVSLRRALHAQRVDLAIHHLHAASYPSGRGTTHVVELAAGRPRPRERARRKLRAAARAGVEVRRGDASDVPALLTILATAADARGRHRYADDAVALVAACGRALILVASHENRDVSAALFLHSPLEVFYWLGGTLPDAVQVSPSYAVIDAAIAFAAEQRCRFANLGSSDRLEGVGFFKEAFGARRVRNPLLVAETGRYRVVTAMSGRLRR